jgi:hypothetical protein
MWPFRPLYERTPDENKRWWQHCYTPAEAEAILHNEPRWCVITGGPGSGRSVALAALEMREAGRSLIIPYAPEYWPGTARAFVPGGDHLAQIMAQASLVVRALFTDHPEMRAKIASLTVSQREFLRWLLERVGGERAFVRWADSIEPEAASLFADITPGDLYPTTTQSVDIVGQVEELAALTRRLGYRRLLVLADLSAAEARTQLANLEALYSAHDLMSRPGFVLVAAIPGEAIVAAELVRRMRARVGVAVMEWQPEHLRDIVVRHWRVALNNAALAVEDIVAPDLWLGLETVVSKAVTAPGPGIWVKMAEAVLNYAAHNGPPKTLPMRADCLPEIGTAFFQQHIPLRLDGQKQGVWRGEHFIPLAEQRWNFLRVLSERNGVPIESYDEALHVALGHARTSGKVGSKTSAQASIHTIAARLREDIEPFPSRPTYVINKGGYYLENFTNERD